MGLFYIDRKGLNMVLPITWFACLTELYIRTFLVRSLGLESLNLYQMDFKMEANGVTPMPAPTSMLTS